MFQKTFEKIRDFLRSLEERPSELKPGMIVDVLSEESFPTRASLAAAIEPTFNPVFPSSVLGPAVVPPPPLWYLRVQTEEGARVELPLDERERRDLIESLRGQVARNGIVSSIPKLPNLSSWLEGENSDSR